MDPVQEIPDQDEIEVGEVVESDDDDSPRVFPASFVIRRSLVRYSRR
jgi:hypothetical protein